MQTAKLWLLGIFLGAALIGSAMLFGTPSLGRAERAEEQKEHWRYHDGHWSYWQEGDKRWYYTDGTHWFYNDPAADATAWQVYRFDKQFGRAGFERGEYKIPEERAKIVAPRHRAYRH